MPIVNKDHDDSSASSILWRFITHRRMLPSIGAVLALLLVYGSFFTVDQTELANVRRFGIVIYPKNAPLLPGLHFKIPLIDQVDKMTVTLQTLHIPPFPV